MKFCSVELKKNIVEDSEEGKSSDVKADTETRKISGRHFGGRPRNLNENFFYWRRNLEISQYMRCGTFREVKVLL